MANIKQLYEDNNKTVEAYPRVWLPVGSLYWNENDISADISKYFVGTWQRVKDVFILAAGDTYTAKTSGGEATHTLTVNETPSHTHTRGTMNITGSIVPSWTDSSGGGIIFNRGASGAFYTSQSGVSRFSPSVNEGAQDNQINFDASRNWTGATSSVGGSQSHNNMPPYYTAYCWKRIS